MSCKLSFSIKLKRLFRENNNFYTVPLQNKTLHLINNFRNKTLNGKGKKKRMNKLHKI